MAILRSKLIKELKQQASAKAMDKLIDYYFQDKWPRRSEFDSQDVTSIRSDMRKLEEGWPLAYVTGIAYFFEYRLNVDERVLIPRPETEELVAWILESEPEDKNILDIGTGSACIPIVLDLKTKNNHITAWDVSHAALELAKENADRLNASVKFEASDILNLRKDKAETRWDIIVSNPPYVKPSEGTDSILYEPETALYTPENDPLIFYKEIGIWAKRSLLPAGMLFFELSEFTYHEVHQFMQELGFNDIELRKDLQGKYRMMKITNT